MSNKYIRDMKTIEHIINKGNNYDKFTSNNSEIFTDSEENFSNLNQFQPVNQGYNNAPLTNNVLHHSNPVVNSYKNPLFKTEKENIFLTRNMNMDMENNSFKSNVPVADVAPRLDTTKNESPKKESKVVHNDDEENKETFKNEDNNTGKPTVKLFILGIIITFGFITALSWHEVSKYYIARSIKFYKGTSLYYIYYASSVTVLFMLILIINHFS